MRDLSKLMDAIYEAYDSALTGITPRRPFAPITGDKGEMTTFCNEAFNLICKRAGCNLFDDSTPQNPLRAKTANDMADFMADPNTRWRFIDQVPGAQNLANAGALVAAIWKNYAGPHGHVCALVPGSAEFSGSWGAIAPKVMNVGETVFIGKRASFAFTKEKMPRYFVWEG